MMNGSLQELLELLDLELLAGFRRLEGHAEDSQHGNTKEGSLGTHIGGLICSLVEQEVDLYNTKYFYDLGGERNELFECSDCE